MNRATVTFHDEQATIADCYARIDTITYSAPSLAVNCHFVQLAVGFWRGLTQRVGWWLICR